jgi:hypothetical protein
MLKLEKLKHLDIMNTVEHCCNVVVDILLACKL